MLAALREKTEKFAPPLYQRSSQRIATARGLDCGQIFHHSLFFAPHRSNDPDLVLQKLGSIRSAALNSPQCGASRSTEAR